MRRWNIKNQDEAIVRAMCDELNCSHFFARILFNRGIKTIEEARDFLAADPKDLLDPYSFKQMDQAVERIAAALRNGQKITVYGDYDVDGITATALLVEFLRSLGGEVDYYIPNRFTDGYGVNSDAIKAIAANGTNLIITVDTGITAINETEEAKALGMDIIITDHHECQAVLPDTIIINPKQDKSGYPFLHLAGVGVVFKLVCALNQRYGAALDEAEFTPFAAIGTIADIMAMKGENRFIVRRGLELLKATKNPGLRAMIDRCVGDRPIDTSTIGFVLAPRINASGRMGNAETGVELLTTKDPQRAEELVEELCKENNRRQSIETSILEDAIAMIEGDDQNKKRNAIVLWDERWHNGVVGIVASRLKERYNKPCILFSVSGEYAKGSGRSIKPFNLFEALESIAEKTEKFGGHAYASGVLVRKERLEEFRDAFCNEVDRFLQKDRFDDSIEIDCTLHYEDLALKNIKMLESLAPFGRENETPIFCMRNVRILEVSPTANGNHLRLSLLCGKMRLTAFYFNVTAADFLYQSGETVDIVFEADVNTYNGRQNVQLSLKDIRFNKRETQQFIVDYKRIERGKAVVRDIPNRTETAAVYRYLQSFLAEGGKHLDLLTLSGRIEEFQGIRLSFGVIFHSLEALRELGVLEYERNGLEIRNLEIHSEHRVNLEDSLILKNIKREAGEMACV